MDPVSIREDAPRRVVRLAPAGDHEDRPYDMGSSGAGMDPVSIHKDAPRRVVLLAGPRADTEVCPYANSR